MLVYFQTIADQLSTLIYGEENRASTHYISIGSYPKPVYHII
jgi:hypothetical protein